MNESRQPVPGRLNKVWSWLLLSILAILIKLSSTSSGFIERYYSNGLYPIISKTQRFLLGWLPFSFGDLIYASFLILIVIKLWHTVRAVINKQFNKHYILSGLRQLLFFCLLVYVLFYLLWGLNYSRRGIASQLNLQMKTYSVGELDSLTNTLQERLNYYASQVQLAQRDSLASKKKLFTETTTAYNVAGNFYKFLQYQPRSIKPSLFSYVGNVLGFEGYYNPFSGEAQINTTIPVFEQPFVACHEVGHQAGYAKENEANFAGFLACRLHPSSSFRYSVYFDMYNYAIGELYRSDSAKAKKYIASLHPLVKKDYQDLTKFFKKYENPLEPVITWLYGKYLQANNQPAGKRTYSEVIAFLIAYQRKYGLQSL